MRARWMPSLRDFFKKNTQPAPRLVPRKGIRIPQNRSEEHTSELQSHVRISAALFIDDTAMKLEGMRNGRIVASSDGRNIEA